MNEKLKAGQSVRNVQILRQILSAALTRAVLEELVARNVARLVELPTWQPTEVVPWTTAEAFAFLNTAADEPLYPAFVLLLLYGMRRGEVLGLRWIAVGGETIHIRQQIQRIQGELHIGPVKTRAGSRDLPLLSLAKGALTARRESQDSDRVRLGSAWIDTGLVITTRTGRPVEPRNLVRSFAPHLRCQRHPPDPRPHPSPYHRLPAQAARRPGPRHASHPRPCACHHHAADLHAR